MKATHIGHCQVCNRPHKINPKFGTVSKHGYTLRFGWGENGTCDGSYFRPYEVTAERVIELKNELVDIVSKLEIDPDDIVKSKSKLRRLEAAIKNYSIRIDRWEEGELTEIH